MMIASAMKMMAAMLRSIGIAIAERAAAISLPFNTAIAMMICRSNPQNTVRHRIALRLFESKYAMARINTNPIRAENRSTSRSYVRI